MTKQKIESKNTYICIDGSGSFTISCKDRSKKSPAALAVNSSLEKVKQAERTNRNYIRVSMWGGPVGENIMFDSTMYPFAASKIAEAMAPGLYCGTELDAELNALQKIMRDARRKADHIIIITDGDTHSCNATTQSLETLLQDYPDLRVSFVIVDDYGTGREQRRTTDVERIFDAVSPQYKSRVQLSYGDSETFEERFDTIMDGKVIPAADAALTSAKEEVGQLRTLFTEALTRLEKLEAKLDNGGKKPSAGGPAAKPN